MNNFDRADRMERALAAIGVTDLKGDFELAPDGYPVRDAICDLFHVLARYGFDLKSNIETALADYGSDVLEQAWLHNEEWADPLQTASNRERAIAVMRSAGVPEQITVNVYDEALRRSGIDR